MSEIPLQLSLREPDETLLYGKWPCSAAFWAACAYLALYVIRPWETLVPELGQYNFERFAYIAILAVIAASAGLRIRFDGPTVGVLIFTTALCVSAINARDPALAWGSADGLYVYLTKIAGLIIIVSVVRTPYQLMMLLTAAVVVMSLFAGKSLWEYLLHSAGRHSMGVYRLRGINGTFGHPNALATVLVPALAWWLCLWRGQQWITAEWSRPWQKRYRWFLYAAPVLTFACVLMSGSRAGAAGLAVFLVLATASAANRFKVVIVGLVLCLTAWTLMSDANKQRIRSIWDSSAAVEGAESSKQGRIEGFRAGVQMLKSYPLTGVGIGNFSAYRQQHVDGSDLSAHNIPGELFGEAGLLGTLAFVWLLICLHRATRRIQQVDAICADSTTEVFSNLATAVRQSVYLLLFLGLANHLSYHFTWIWLAAFCSCLLWHSSRHLAMAMDDQATDDNSDTHTVTALG